MLNTVEDRRILAAVTTASMVGEVLGSYRVTRELSTGRMGTVSRATHELLGRPRDELVERFFADGRAGLAMELLEPHEPAGSPIVSPKDP
jgi:hypothetical protein